MLPRTAQEAQQVRAEAEDAEKLRTAHKCVTENLERLPNLPCRVDEMTPDQLRLYNEFIAPLTGCLTFLREFLEED